MAPIPGISCMGAVGGGSIPLSSTYVTTSRTATNSASSTVSFSSVSIGAEPASNKRRFIVAIYTTTVDGSRNDVTAMTLDGNPMTKVAAVWHNGTADALVGMYYLEAPTGTTASFNVTQAGSGTSYRRALSVYRVISGPSGISVANSYTDTADGLTFTISANAGNSVIGGAHAYQGGPFTISYLSEDYDTNLEVGDYTATAHLDPSVSVTGQAVAFDTASNPGITEAGIVAVFEPL